MMPASAKLWQPENVLSPYKTLDLNGATVIRSCHTQSAAIGDLFLHSHLLFFVVEGEIHIKHGTQKFSLRRGEAVFIRKDSHFSYEKTAAQNHSYQSLLFFLENDLLLEFGKFRRRIRRHSNENLSIVKIEANPKMLAFVETVNAYFDEQLSSEPDLLRLKMLEILFILASLNEDLTDCFYQFTKAKNDDLAQLMETNFNQNLSLAGFAQMSGRSLSKFKRDFQTTFSIAPLQWLREKRLDYAHRLLSATDKNVSDVCYEAGFENLSHFSRLFRQHFGCSPSRLKKEPHGKKT